MDQRAWAFFAQDKWRVNQNLTFNLGLRYDLEFTPLDNSANPYFADDPDDYPLDKNNFSPRVGATYTWDEGRSLLRSGWGLFYDKVNFGMVVDFDRNGINSDSFVAQFPADRIDPGPRAGQMPTNPMLVNGPVVNRALLNQLYPPGQAIAEHRRGLARPARTATMPKHPADEPRLPAAARDPHVGCPQTTCTPTAAACS